MSYAGSPTYNPGFWTWWPYFGFYDFGAVQVPPLPPISGMINRSDGSTWYLCWSPDQGNRLCLSNQIPQAYQARTKVYQPYDGPFLEAQGLRMGVANAGPLGNAHVVYDQSAIGSSGAGPWGFGVNTNALAAQVAAVSTNARLIFDHLAYRLTVTRPVISTFPPWFAMYERGTGKIWYFGWQLQGADNRMVLTDEISNLNGPRSKVYGPNETLWLGTRGYRLSLSLIDDGGGTVNPHISFEQVFYNAQRLDSAYGFGVDDSTEALWLQYATVVDHLAFSLIENVTGLPNDGDLSAPEDYSPGSYADTWPDTGNGASR